MSEEARTESWDAVVIGAGPAGSAAAAEIAARGIGCLLLERGPAPGAKVACGGGVPYALMRRLGLEAIVDNRIAELRLTAGGEDLRVRMPKPAFAAVRRRVFDAALAERAVGKGAVLRCNHLVRRLRPGTRPGTPMQLEVEDLSQPQAREIEVTAQVVVVADGLPTIARRDLGIGFDPRTQWTAYALKYQARYDGEYPSDCFSFVVDENRLDCGYFWIFPKTGYLNVGAGTIVASPGARVRPDLDSVIREIGASAGLDWQKITILERRGGLIPLEMAREWVTDGALVVGDAAGLVNPVTAGGLVYSVRSGEVAGQIVAEALCAGDTSAARLGRYRRELMRSRYYWWIKAMWVVARATYFLQRRHPPALRHLHRWFYFPLMRVVGRLRNV